MAPTAFRALSKAMFRPQPLFRASVTPLRVRALATTPAFRRPQDPEEHPNEQRGAQQDREKMDTQSNEYSKSGTDAASAGQDEAAFDPNSSNDPQDEKSKASEGNEVNPLDASPANPDISSGTAEEEGGAGKKQSEQ